MTVGTKALAHMVPTSGSVPRQLGTLTPGAAPGGADAAVSAGALPKASDPLPAPHLAEAVRAAAAARAAAARIRAAVPGGNAPAAEQPGSAAVVDCSRWRGLSVAEAVAAATISFRPLRRPFGRLPHGAPQCDLQSIEVGPIAADPSRPEQPGASAPSEAGMPRPLATTIAELERLRQAARQQEERPQLLLMSARA